MTGHPGFSRRGLLIGAGVVAALAACPDEIALADPTEPLPLIAHRFAALEQQYGALIGVLAMDLDTRRTVATRADDPFAMCSTFKTYATAAVLRKAQLGEIHLTDAVAIDAADVVANSPITQPRVGGTMTLAELCQAALQHSDNTAGNWLLRTIGGPSAVTDFARTIGDDRTRLDRWETELNSAVPGDPRDTGTPRALAAGYERLLTGSALAPAQRAQLERWMRGNQTSSMRAGLPPRWTSADKTGGGDYGSTNDIGIGFGPGGRRAVLSIMTRSQADDPNAESLRPLIAEVTALVLPYLSAERPN